MDDKQTKKPEPMRYCFCCGAEIGRSRYYDRLDTCGERECEREALDVERHEVEQARAEIDQIYGW